MIFITWSTHFNFLALNTLLAYIPIELSFQIQKTKNHSLQIGLAFLWLLFFPNIPYLATDIIHTDLLNLYNNTTGMSVESVRGWGLIFILFLVAFSYINWGFTELFSLAELAKQKLKLRNSVMCLGLCFVSLLSSMGMYAGRFSPRLHSKHFFMEPLRVLEIIFLQWSMKKAELIILFFLLHVGIMGTLYVTRKSKQSFIREN